MIGKKYAEASTGATHKEVDATIVDLINPMAPLDSTGSLVRSVIHVGATYFGTRKMLTGSFTAG